MAKITVYQNPQCSTCQAVMDSIRCRDDEVEVVNYMEQRLTEGTLRKLLQQLQMRPQELIRWKDYAKLELPQTDDEDKLIEFMVAHPEIIQRPIIVVDGKSALCRPAEKVSELLPPQHDKPQ